MTVDPLASQRVVLLGKVIAAQSSLERVIADLARANVSTSIADSQLARLAFLQASIGSADIAALHSLGAEVSAAIAQSRSIEQQARDQVASADLANSSASLSQAAAASSASLRDAMDSLKHIPLTFTSPEDEQAYRDREKERAEYMAAQQAKHTTQGDLNAAGAGVGQMVDAKAHGASGPEFDQKWNALVSTTEKLRAEAKANGISTEEFDQRLRDDLRRIMKSKGYSDAQIEAQLASKSDPLDAAKAFVKDGADIDTLRAQVDTDKNHATVMASTSPSSSGDDMAAYIASLKASGIVASDMPKDADPHHGVALAAGNSSVRTV